MNKLVNQLKAFIPLLLFIIIGFFLWRGLSLDPHKVPSALIGRNIPDFNLPRLTQPDSLLSNKLFLGHVSLLNVWATWCVACAEEHPILVDIAATKQVPIYGLDYKDSRPKALAYLKQYGDPYQVIGFDRAGKTAINWGVYGTPETFIIDKHGVIRYKQIGPINHKRWQQKLLPMVIALQKQS